MNGNDKFKEEKISPKASGTVKVEQFDENWLASPDFPHKNYVYKLYFKDEQGQTKQLFCFPGKAKDYNWVFPYCTISRRAGMMAKPVDMAAGTAYLPSESRATYEREGRECQPWEGQVKFYPVELVDPTEVGKLAAWEMTAEEIEERKWKDFIAIVQPEGLEMNAYDKDTALQFLGQALEMAKGLAKGIEAARSVVKEGYASQATIKKKLQDKGCDSLLIGIKLSLERCLAPFGIPDDLPEETEEDHDVVEFLTGTGKWQKQY